MSKNPKGCECNCDGSVVSGNSLDLDINYCESEIRADVVVSEYSSVRLWGRIVNCDGKPVPNALVKLLRVECDCKKVYYTGIAHTVSDCDGFYQFEICNYNEHENNVSYKVLVSKAAYGAERVVNISGGNCDPCESPSPCEPCDPYQYNQGKEYQQMPSQGQEYVGYYDDNDCNCGPDPYHQKQKQRY